MPVFSYRATTRDGAIVEGSVEASDEKSAIDRLRNSDIIPLLITAPKEKTGGILSIKSSKADILTFTAELSTLLKAGLPLDRSLNILSDISANKAMKEVVLSVLKSIREGNSFSDALQRHPRVFPRLYVNMVKAGESGGVLDVVLEKLVEFLESTKELKEHVVSAMIYPAILSLTGGISIIILLTYVLPKFTTIFEDLGTSLPFATQMLLALSNGVKSYGWIFAILSICAVILFRKYIGTEDGRYKWDAFKLKILKDIIQNIETARFCRTVGTLLKSGVPLLQAMSNAKDIISNKVIANSLNEVAKDIKEGKGISAPLSKANIFPPLALSMIKVGEETGQLDEMLLKTAGTYEKNLKALIKRFMGLVEPAMILGMGIVIGFIVLSMLIAIFSITELPF
jgi:general secretion pathway protein F